MTTSLLLLARKMRVRNLFPIILAVLIAVSFENVNAQPVPRVNCTVEGVVDPLGTPGVTLDPISVPMFQNNLPVIKELGLRYDLTDSKKNKIQVKMEETFQDLGLGLTDAMGAPVLTRVWGYRFPTLPATYPGATIIAEKDNPVEIKWKNQLPGHFLPVDASLHMAHPNNIMGAAAVRAWYAAGNVPTVAHLHGGHTESASDGLPEAWFTQLYAEVGNYFMKQKYWYDNDQEAATLWYHDHALGITRLNVYAGLAGFYLLRDDNENSLINEGVLPGGDYEIEIVIQDRLFDQQGQLFWPAYEGETPWGDFIEGEGADVSNTDVFPGDPATGRTGGPTALAEMFGNIILVNGKAWPRLQVEPRKYRFRLLNGSDSRFYILQLNDPNDGDALADRTNDDGKILVIGTDDGLLPSPVEVQELAIAPGERYDIVIDFGQIGSGSNINLINNGPDSPAGGAEVDTDDLACFGTTGQIMQFQVTKQLSTVPDASVALGTTLRDPIVPLVTNAPARQLVLFEGMDEYGRLQPMLGTLDGGSQTWFEPITENPDLDAIEEWEVYNATGDAHPIHLHLVSFQILNRESFAGNVVPRPQIQHSSLPVLPGDLPTFSDPPTTNEIDAARALNYGIGGTLKNVALAGGATGPEAYEDGWKDTFIVPPGQVGRVRAKFDRLGRYVWHCHILSHEDHEMMRPFHVGPIPNTAARMASNIERNIENVPNPFVYKTQVLFKIEKSQNVDFSVYDTQGKLLYHNLNFYREGKNAIFWDGFDKEGKLLPTGVYIYRLHGENFQEAKKLVIER